MSNEILGYLLDTQIIADWFDGESGRFPLVEANAAKRSADAPLYVSSITLGEIAYGHAVNPFGAGATRDRFLRFVATKLPQVASVTHHTTEHYGALRACLVEKCAPRDGWGKKKRAEQMCDPLTALELGIDENDLWIMSLALERNVTLVTGDKMARLRDAVRSFKPDFCVENWREA
jgi:predicted nucleic acid-binding protein